MSFDSNKELTATTEFQHFTNAIDMDFDMGINIWILKYVRRKMGIKLRFHS